MGIADAFRRLMAARRTTVYVRGAVAAIAGMDATELYRRQPALRSVVRFLADNMASIPLKCYVRAADDDRPRDTTSALAVALQRPSRSMTQYELMRATFTDLLLFEDALWVVVPDSAAPAGTRIQHVPWTWVAGMRSATGLEPEAFEVTNAYNGGTATFPADWCVHFRGYDPGDPMRGASPIDALREVLTEQVNSWHFRNAVWRNGGRVTQFLTRPANAPTWEPQNRERFARSWKERFSGEGGTDTGGTPLLEDGMELKSVTFNAREAQWQEATRLSREDVAAVYGLNPSQVWHSESQTYASARDNARALYADTLAPYLQMAQQRINASLVPMLGADPARSYAEFDISSKLAASFEEQASVLQSSVGGPWITRNEARARVNMPAIEGGDELIVPLNVSEGGLASPNDTDPTIDRYSSARPSRKSLPEGEGRQSGPFGGDARRTPVRLLPGKDVTAETVRLVRIKATASTEASAELADAIRAFMRRGSKDLSAKLAALDLQDDDALEAIGAVLEREREAWTEAFARTLYEEGRLGTRVADAARRVVEVMGYDAGALDVAVLDGCAEDLCAGRSAAIVRNFFDNVRDSVLEPGGLSEGRVSGAVGKACGEAMRMAEHNAQALARNAANAGAVAGASRTGARCQKQWVATGVRTRDSHAAMNGETVPVNSRFSNGAMWPGDPNLPASETSHCHCRVDIVADGTALLRRHRARDVADELGLSDYDADAVDSAISAAQSTSGLSGAVWEDLSERERGSVLSDLRSRDREWVATGTCATTRAAADPRALELRSQMPREYAVWQELVSRIARVPFSGDQAKHIAGEEGPQGGAGESSYFKLPGTSVDERELALRIVVNQLAGGGTPKLIKDKISEVVRTNEVRSHLAEADKDGEGFKIHYAPAADSLHVVPWAHLEEGL